MSRRFVYTLFWALTLVVVLATMASAFAGTAARARKQVKIKAVCHDALKPNRFFKEGCRWGRDRYKIRSGGTVTLDNRSDEPHTFSLVRASQVPSTLKKAGKCFDTTGVCTQLANAHGNSDNGPPPNPLLNQGAPGFDVPGDSIFFAPKSKTKIQITAKRGAKLHFICILHPQMQAVLAVK
jgi:hypothetical protein